jgi:hypothetical protein
LTSLGRLIARVLLAAGAALCVAALASSVASAAPTGGISGTVIGADTQEGIEGVEVCATRHQPAFLESCENTAADGTYAIEGLGAGEYEVWFYAGALGYRITSLPDPVPVDTEPVAGIDAELVPFSQITGTVTRSSDGEPVEEVEVCAWELPGEELAACAYTEFDGSYLLDELEPGEYGIEFWPYESGQNLIGQFYDHRSRWEEADPVVVEEGETVSGIDAVLDPGATISGHVYAAATGGALEEIPVCAIEVVSGELWVCDWTRPDGNYELPFLSSGQYKVVFSIDFEEWYEEEFEEEESDGFPTEFWNEQSTLAAANAISVATGQNVTGIDAHLGPPAPQPPSSQPPASVIVPPITRSVTTLPATAKRKHCRRGFKRKKVKGKVRCVKSKKRRHPHAAAHSRLTDTPASLSPIETRELHRLRSLIRDR